ncbi:MAG: hypothetical protein QGG02_07640 [Gammaproteobacteria bacterium]|jgi:hypothetical protein|nr:hypothetical protein [Gammaproteobacteria bacterium]MDP6732838.1 hypothetical protein [Gammaproteobacteria bacterium]|tara:strand:+ start:303 stop:875 length:573 start_codon:yes stop_codon:yes gene_type:complete
MLRDLLPDSLLHRKVLWCFSGVLIVAVVFPTLFEIIFATADEISFSAGTGLSTCGDFFIEDETARDFCTTPIALVVGNTGTNTQEIVDIRVSPLPDYVGLSSSAQDIVATARRADNPVIVENHSAERLHFTLKNLAANKLVEILLITRGAEQGQLLENLSIDIDATGTIIETNPRLTVMARFARYLVGVF